MCWNGPELLTRITAGGDHAYFEFAEPLLSHHHHLVCVDCGSIEDVYLDDELRRASIGAWPRLLGVRASRLYGTASTCTAAVPAAGPADTELLPS